MTINDARSRVALGAPWLDEQAKVDERFVEWWMKIDRPLVMMHPSICLIGQLTGDFCDYRHSKYPCWPWTDLVVRGFDVSIAHDGGYDAYHTLEQAWTEVIFWRRVAGVSGIARSHD